MYGWHGSILRVNLSEEFVTKEFVSESVAKAFLGGRGWAIKYLYDEMDPAVDALSPENILIYATGPLTATPAPTGNRYMVVTKSPLTGALTNSNSGGEFPTELKRTGYDLIIVEGKASNPVFLWVNEDDVQIKSAEHIWGKTVPETEDILLTETDKKAKVACIGPAGERLVKIASIMNDKHRAAGRSGVGAVMGSKNLKAVVVRGKKEPSLAYPEGMRDYSKEIRLEVLGDIKKGSTLREYGTAYVPEVTNELGVLPTRNFKTGVFEGVDGITGEVLKEKYLVNVKPCYKCPIACGRVTELDGNPYEGEGEGPEYESIASLGSSCGVDSMAAVTKANYLCNELGLDTISTGVTISCAIELFEINALDEEDAGMSLEFGDPDIVMDLIAKTAYREGFGDEIAEGSYRLASKYGHPELSITAKKLEFPGYDPRGSKGMGLLYATSNIGASHMAGDTAYPEIFGVPEKIDPLSIKDKPSLVKLYEDAFAVIDAAGLCVFLSVRYLFDQNVMIWPTRLSKIMNLATGADYTPETVLQAGERIFNLERLFLLKAGFKNEDDTLPKRMLEEPMPDGPAKGETVELEQMLVEFYKQRGWDENGVPTPEKLKELDLLQ